MSHRETFHSHFPFSSRFLCLSDGVCACVRLHTCVCVRLRACVSVCVWTTEAAAKIRSPLSSRRRSCCQRLAFPFLQLIHGILIPFPCNRMHVRKYQSNFDPLSSFLVRAIHAAQEQTARQSHRRKHTFPLCISFPSLFLPHSLFA